MAEQSAFLTAFDEMQKKKGGFNAPAPVAPGFKPQVPQELSAPQVGPTLANEATKEFYAEHPLKGFADYKSQDFSRDAVNRRADFDAYGEGFMERRNSPLKHLIFGDVSDTSPYAQKGLGDGEGIREGYKPDWRNPDGTYNNANEPGAVPETPNMLKKGFDYLFGAPTAEQAQNTLDTMPTDPAQRARLQATASGTGSPSDLAKAGSFLFGRPEVEGDPNILGAQTPEEVAASPAEVTPAGATPAVAAPVMDGSQIPQAGEEGFKFAERGSPQDYFLSNTNDGTTALSPEQITRGQEYAKQQGLNFDPTTGFSQSGEAPQVQAPQGLTTAGGQPLAEFLAGGQQKDAQGRMIDPNVDRSSFEQASADREARQAARPDFGAAVSDRDRRAARGEGISDADRSDIAKAQNPNASASDRARGMKVAEKAGLDWKTGQPLKQGKETGGLTDYQAITAQQRQTEIDMKIAEGMEAKEAKREVAYEESRSNVRSTQDSFDKLKPVAEEIALLSGGKLTEGVLGWTASKLPFSTDAAQIERLTTEFEGSAFLQGLIDAKAKGATFGALSEREGDRILGQWGKITSPKSTNEQRIRAVNSMLESIQRSSERATSDHKEKFPDRSARSSKAQAQGSPKGKRYPDDQDHAAKVDTHFQT